MAPWSVPEPGIRKLPRRHDGHDSAAGVTAIHIGSVMTPATGQASGLTTKGMTMSMGLELYESRVNRVDSIDGLVTIHFSHAAIYNAKGLPGRDPGTTWSQEAVLSLTDAAIATAGPALPNMIADGFVETDGKRYEVIPVPLGEHAMGRVHLEFTDGSVLDVIGKHPVIALLGNAIRLEDFQ